MTQNHDIIAAHYAASERGDITAMLAPLSPDVRWTEMDGSPYRGTYRGPAAVAAGVFERIAADWESFTVSIDEILDAGDTIIGVGEYSGTHKATGRAFTARVTHVWRLKRGTVMAFEQFTDTLQIARASGEY